MSVVVSACACVRGYATCHHGYTQIERGGESARERESERASERERERENEGERERERERERVY
jgi:hypothetical protein